MPRSTLFSDLPGNLSLRQPLHASISWRTAPELFRAWTPAILFVWKQPLARLGRIHYSVETTLCVPRLFVEPSFVTGKIRKGVKDGDPCTTHQDTYENYAMVLLGRKIFYTAKPLTFEDESKWRGSGEET